MTDLDEEWLKFQESGLYENNQINNTNINEGKNPKCSEIYISTQT